MKVFPLKGRSIDTEFEVSLENFVDERMAISYKYSYYLGMGQYEKEILNG